MLGLYPLCSSHLLTINFTMFFMQTWAANELGKAPEGLNLANWED